MLCSENNLNAIKKGVFILQIYKLFYWLLQQAIPQNFEMPQIDQQEVVTTEQQKKIISLYTKRYDLNVGMFINFVHEKIQIDSFQIDLIKQKLEQFGIEESFNLSTLALLLRITAAAQIKGNAIRQMSSSQLIQFEEKIAFKTSKKSKNSDRNQKASEDSTSQNKLSQNQQRKHSKQANKNQQIASQSGTKEAQKSELYIKQSSIQIQEQSDGVYMQPYYSYQANSPPKTSSKTQTTRKENSQPQIKQQTSKKEANKKAISIKTNQEADQQHEEKFTKKKFVEPKIQRLKTIEQVQNSSEIILNNNSELRGKIQFMQLTDSKEEKQKVKILSYQKFSTDYINSVIKYTLQYGKFKVLRRFSEFEKLLNLLRQNYEGFILPDLPSKQVVKTGISFFWGVDEDLLQQRKQKLQQMLNRLLQTKGVNEDKVLLKFLTDQTFEIQQTKQEYSTYIKKFTDIVLNAKEIKDYGVAYCNYLRQKGNVKLNPKIQQKYEQIKKIIQVFATVNEYRKKINKNFDERRQLYFEMGVKSRKPYKANFDKTMDGLQQQIKNLGNEIERYKKLKFEQSWIYELIRQKQNDNVKVKELKEEQQKIEKRLFKVQQNLSTSLDEFKESKSKKLNEISSYIVEWRECVHP